MCAHGRGRKGAGGSEWWRVLCDGAVSPGEWLRGCHPPTSNPLAAAVRVVPVCERRWLCYLPHRGRLQCAVVVLFSLIDLNGRGEVAVAGAYPRCCSAAWGEPKSLWPRARVGISWRSLFVRLFLFPLFILRRVAERIPTIGTVWWQLSVCGWVSTGTACVSSVWCGRSGLLALPRWPHCVGHDGVW